METTTVKRTLRYDFTEAERLELGRELSLKNQELRQLEDSKKSVVAEYSSRLTIAKEQINVLSDKVASGYETRDIYCDLQYHCPERNKKTYTRTDNGEAWVEAMTDVDHNLFNQWEEKEQKRLAEGADNDLSAEPQVKEPKSEFNEAENEAA